MNDNKEQKINKEVYLLLELNDLGDPVLDELSLGDDQLLPVLGGLVEEAGVDLRLLVLQGHVAGQDIAVLQPIQGEQV